MNREFGFATSCREAILVRGASRVSNRHDPTPPDSHKHRPYLRDG